MSTSEERIHKMSGESCCSARSSEQETYRRAWNPKRHLLFQSRLVKNIYYTVNWLKYVQLLYKAIHSQHELWLSLCLIYIIFQLLTFLKCFPAFCQFIALISGFSCSSLPSPKEPNVKKCNKVKKRIISKSCFFAIYLHTTFYMLLSVLHIQNILQLF